MHETSVRLPNVQAIIISVEVVFVISFCRRRRLTHRHPHHLKYDLLHVWSAYAHDCWQRCEEG